MHAIIKLQLTKCTISKGLAFVRVQDEKIRITEGIGQPLTCGHKKSATGHTCPPL